MGQDETLGSPQSPTKLKYPRDRADIPLKEHEFSLFWTAGVWHHEAPSVSCQ